MNQLFYVAQGYLPYRDIGYNFPPLFLYTLYPFYILGGPSWAGLPIVISDAATAPVVFLLTRTYASNKVATAAGLGYALSPLILIYEGYLWIGNQPMIFFVVLSLYLFGAKKPMGSAIALGIAILFRQQALFILPAYAFLAFGQDRKLAARLLLVVIGVMLVGSAPFLLLAPGQYLSSLSYLPLYNWTPLFANPAVIRGAYIEVTVNFCTSLSRVATGFIMSCQFGGSSYLTLAPFGSPLLIFANNMSNLLRLPIAIIVLPLLYLARHKSNWLQLTSAYAAAISVTVFALVIHYDYRYYYLLFYAVLLTSATTRGGLLIAICASIFSLLIPELAMQAVLPFIALIGMVLTQELTDLKRVTPTSTPLSARLPPNKNLAFRNER